MKGYSRYNSKGGDKGSPFVSFVEKADKGAMW